MTYEAGQSGQREVLKEGKESDLHNIYFRLKKCRLMNYSASNQ